MNLWKKRKYIHVHHQASAPILPVLQSLKDNGIVRISSKELADRMGLTASQIRHDFNSFGGFGQQGYGYNVPELQKRIGEILCVDKELKTILIGA